MKNFSDIGICEDVDGYFYIQGDYVKGYKGMIDNIEADKTVGPSSLVTRWHNDGIELSRKENGSQYPVAYKIKVTDECVKNNLTIMKAMPIYNLAHATLKNWFCQYNVRERRMDSLKERALELRSKGLCMQDIANALDVSIRSARSYCNGD